VATFEGSAVVWAVLFAGAATFAPVAFGTEVAALAPAAVVLAATDVAAVFYGAVAVAGPTAPVAIIFVIDLGRSFDDVKPVAASDGFGFVTFYIEPRPG